MCKCYIANGIMFKGKFGISQTSSKLEFMSKKYFDVISLTPKALHIIEKISDYAMSTLANLDDIISQHDIISFMIWFTSSFNLNSIMDQLILSVDKYNGKLTHAHNRSINTYSAKFKIKIAKAIIARTILSKMIK